MPLPRTREIRKSSGNVKSIRKDALFVYGDTHRQSVRALPPFFYRRLNMYGYPDFYDVQQQHHFQKCTIWWAVIVAILTTIIFMAISSCNQTPARANELTASWYSVESLKKEGTYKYSKGVMANGEVFNNSLMVCATRLYSLGSLLRIQNITTGRSVTVRVTDRIGKRFATKRIDLSKRAFSEIADLKQGIVSVKIEIIELAKQ